MNKSSYVLILIVIVVTVFTTSCQDNEKWQSAKDLIDTKEVIDHEHPKENILRLSHWTMSDTSRFKELIQEYNQTNKDHIQVKILEMSQERYTEKMNMLMASGNGPDVFGLKPELIHTYILKNWLIDVTEHIDNDFFNDYPDWVYAYSKAFDSKERIYTIPSSQRTYRLIYNKDLFKRSGIDPEKPPMTFEELKDYAKKISYTGLGDRKYGFALAASDEGTGFIQAMEAPLTISGHYFFDFTEGKYDISIYKPWFEMLIDMKKDGSIFPGETSLKSDTAQAQFAEGNIGMMFASSGDPSKLISKYSIKCDWGVAMPPAIDEASKDKGALMVSPDCFFAVNSSTQNPEAAIKLWKYLYSERYLSEMYKSGEVIPINQHILLNKEYLATINNFEYFIPNEGESVYPLTPIGINDYQRMGTYLKAIEDDMNIDELLMEGTKKLNLSLYDLQINNQMNRYKLDTYDPKEPLN